MHRILLLITVVIALAGCRVGFDFCLTDPDCEDGNGCTRDFCETTQCRHEPIEGCQGCEDARDCPGERETCVDGACVELPCQDPGECPDGHSCVNGICYLQDCPGQTCGPDEVCVGNVCVEGACVTVVCEAFEECHGGICQQIPCLTDQECSDSLFCNGEERCLDGSCTGSGLEPCPGTDGDADCAESCDEDLDDCSGPDPDGSACPDDGQFCTGSESCQAGECLSTGDPCGASGCDEDQDICVGCGDGAVGAGEDCDATAGDHCCDAGTCAWVLFGRPDPQGLCSGAPECLIDVCDGSGGCTTGNADDGTPCSDDLLFCTGPERCQGGFCRSAGNPCGALACDEALDECVEDTVAQLNFTNAPLVLGTSQCGQLTVETQTASGAALPAVSDLVLDLSSTSATGGFFSDVACASPISQKTVLAGTSRTSFYYLDTLEGGPLVTADETPDAGLTAAQQTVTISDAACAGVLVGGYCWFLTATGQSCTQVCADHGGYHRATASYAGAYESTTNCQNVLDALGVPGSDVTEMVLVAGHCFYQTSDATRYRAKLPTSPDYSAGTMQRACACMGGSLPEDPPRFVFQSEPLGQSTGYCGTVRVEVRDYGFPWIPSSDLTVEFQTTSPGGTFYSDSGCRTASNLATMTAGSEYATTWYLDAVEGTPTLTADDNPDQGLDPGTQDIVIRNLDTCGGLLYAGFCFYLGNGDQTCAEVCETRGGWSSEGTVGYIGSEGHKTDCRNVLEALGFTIRFLYEDPLYCGCSTFEDGGSAYHGSDPVETDELNCPMPLYNACACMQ